MKTLGNFTNREIAAYQAANLLETDKERQRCYAIVWDSIKKRIKVPVDHRLIITANWEIVDQGNNPKKK